LGSGQHYGLICDGTETATTVKSTIIQQDTVIPPNSIQNPEPYVVPGVPVGFPRIAQPHH